MFDDKRVPKTVHLPQSMWDFIDARASTVCRKRSAEVEYILKKYFEIVEKGNQEAIAMAERAFLKQIQSTPLELDDPSK